MFILVSKNCRLDLAVNMMELLSMRLCMHLDSTTSNRALIEMIMLQLCGRTSGQVGNLVTFLNEVDQ